MSITLKTNSQGHCIPSRHIFNGGEVNVNVDNFLSLTHRVDSVFITARIHNSDDLMELIMVCDALRRARPGVYLNLTLPYLPYSRQDRVCNPGEALGVRVFADMINALNFTTVVTFDAHSDVGVACINNCESIAPEMVLEQAYWKEEEEYLHDRLWGCELKLIAPDAGAVKRVEKVSQYFGGMDVIDCAKVRDTKTGKISHTRVNYGFSLHDTDVLIVDDICDGGMTFIKIAEAMRERIKPKSISLYVTHGIFSKGYEVLFDAGISKIYTTDSFEQDFVHPQVFVVGL